MAIPRSDYHCGAIGLVVCSLYGLYLIALDRGRVRDLEEKQELVLDAYQRTQDHLSYIPEASVHEVRALYFLYAVGEKGFDIHQDIYGPDPNATRTLRVPVRHVVVLLETIRALDDRHHRLGWILRQH